MSKADLRELAEAEAAYLESQAEALKKRAAELREVVKAKADPPIKLEERLESLTWIRARSGKCDYVKDAPAELVEAVRSQKGGVKGTTYHYTASATEATLFRFSRRPES